MDPLNISPALGLPLALAASVAAILYGIITSYRIITLPAGTPKMREISDAIAEGASAYLARQYSVIAAVAVVIFTALAFFLSATTALGFLTGAVASAICGFIGMNISVRANVRTTEAAKKGLRPAFAVAFAGGSVTGLLVAGLALLSVSGFYGATADLAGLIGYMRRLDARSAATLRLILLDAGALAVALNHDHKQLKRAFLGRLRRKHVHADDAVFALEPDTAHTSSHAPHRPYVFFAESHGLAFSSHQYHFIAASGRFDPLQIIVRTQSDSDEPATAHVGKFG